MRLKPNYGTHLPVLLKLLSITDGPILELGVGIFSTPVLHWVALSQKRQLASYESDPWWLHQFRHFYHTYHSLAVVEDWNSIDIEKPWDVVLVDQAPAEARKDTVRRLANHAKYIVLHDTYPKEERHYHYNEIYPLFAHRWDYTEFRPTWATVLSNFVDLKGFTV